MIHYRTPLAEALLGAEKGDEVEILVGSYVRRAVIEEIVRPREMPEG
jgi:transcription elongation GreA/GreB family factor